MSAPLTSGVRLLKGAPRDTRIQNCTKAAQRALKQPALQSNVRAGSGPQHDPVFARPLPPPPVRSEPACRIAVSDSRHRPALPRHLSHSPASPAMSDNGGSRGASPMRCGDRGEASRGAHHASPLAASLGSCLCPFRDDKSRSPIPRGRSRSRSPSREPSRSRTRSRSPRAYAAAAQPR